MFEGESGAVVKILGWVLGIIGVLVVAIKLLVAKIPPVTKADKDFIAQLNHKLVQDLANDVKSLLERLHAVEIKLSVQETQISSIQARLASLEKKGNS